MADELKDTPRVFRYSEATIAKAKQRLLASFGTIMLVCLTLALCLKTGSRLWLTATVLGLACLVIMPFIALLACFAFKWQRRFCVGFDDEAIVIVRGMVKYSFAWSQIAEIRKRLKPNGEISEIELVSAAGERHRLYGFQDMREVSQRIEAKMPTAANVSAKKYMLDYESPRFSVALVLIAIILSGFGYLTLGERFYETITTGLLPCGAGLYLIIFEAFFKRPLDPGWEH